MELDSPTSAVEEVPTQWRRCSDRVVVGRNGYNYL